MSAPTLRSVVVEQRPAILGLFVERVMADEATAPPDGTRRSELVDHLPAFLDGLVEALDEATAPTARTERPQQISSARDHGAQRLRLGFDVEAVVREYGVLRDCILQLVTEASAVVSVAEFAVLAKCIDGGTANAVSEYSRYKHADLERALRAREEVLAVVSHDLRTPLNAIVMSTHVLASRLSAGSREYEVTAAIQRSADEMNRMIRDLLDLASLDAGLHPLEPASERVARLIDDVVSSFGASARARSITLRTSSPADAPDILCDRASMHRVLANLLENALKFTPAGGEIVVGAEARGQRVRFFVADSGSGIPTELRERVFDRFVSTTDPARRGTGLGLYIARGLVEASGGEIGIDSGNGAGSTFWFTLPVVTP